MGFWAWESSKAIQTLGVINYDTSCDPDEDLPEPKPVEPVVVEPPKEEPKEEEDDGLTTGQIVGIAVGSSIGGLLLILLCLCCVGGCIAHCVNKRIKARRAKPVQENGHQKVPSDVPEQLPNLEDEEDTPKPQSNFATLDPPNTAIEVGVKE